MSNNFPVTWFFLSLISVIAISGADLLQQHLLQVKDPLNERASTVLILLVQSFLSLPLIFLLGLHTEFAKLLDLQLFLKFLLVAAVGSSGVLLYFKSLKVKNISLSVVLAMFSVVVSTTLGIIFFHESTHILKFFGIVLIMLAVILVQWKNNLLEKNHFFALAAGISFGISYTLDKSIVTQINPLLYIFVGFLLSAITSFLFGPFKVIDSIKNKPLKSFRPIVLSGLGYFLFNLFTYLSYLYGGEVGRVDAINNTSVFLIILFEFFVLKETTSLGKKIITALIAFAGVAVLGVV
jgi:drug/metabolite transporter (DMT)-like permease